MFGRYQVGELASYTKMNTTVLDRSYQEKSEGNILFMANAIFYVIHNFLLRTESSLVLTLSCRHSQSCNFYHDVLEHLFRIWNKTDIPLQIVVVQNNLHQPVFGRRNRNLILIDSYQAFLDVDIISYTRINNFNEYNYIILKISDNLMEVQLKQLLKYCWRNYMIHCSVQVQNQDGEVHVYTYFPYTAKYCGKVVPVQINQYNGSGFVESELFPKKLKNFYGCSLRAAVWEVPPFMQLSTHGSVTNISGGIEGKLLETLATSLNFSIEAKIPPRNEQRGKLFGITTTGALFMLENRSADLSLGSFRQTIERNAVASYTITYYQTKQVFSALELVYDLTSWQTLVYPYDTSTWLLIFLVFSLILLKTTLANRMYQRCSIFFHHNVLKTDYLNIFSTLIGVPASRSLALPLWTSQSRILFINWLFFTLVIRTVYQALLFHLKRMHVQYKTLQSFDELLESNCTAVMNAGTYEALEDLPIIQRMQIVAINSTIETVAFTYIENMHSTQYLAVGLQEYLMLYRRSGAQGEYFKVLSDVVAFPTTIYLTKHSFLIDQFNEQILSMSVAGLIDLWRRWEVDYGLHKSSIFEIDITFKMKELYMVFVFYGIGLLLACCVFILEICSCRLRVLKNVFNKV